MCLCAAFLLVILSTNLVHGQSEENACASKQNCHECIQAKDRCVWCLQPDFGNKSRCMQIALTNPLWNDGCPAEYIYTPYGEQTTFGEDLRGDVVENQKPVRIFPQKISLKIPLSMF